MLRIPALLIRSCFRRCIRSIHRTKSMIRSSSLCISSSIRIDVLVWTCRPLHSVSSPCPQFLCPRLKEVLCSSRRWQMSIWHIQWDMIRLSQSCWLTRGTRGMLAWSLISLIWRVSDHSTYQGGACGLISWGVRGYCSVWIRQMTLKWCALEKQRVWYKWLLKTYAGQSDVLISGARKVGEHKQRLTWHASASGSLHILHDDSQRCWLAKRSDRTKQGVASSFWESGKLKLRSICTSKIFPAAGRGNSRSFAVIIAKTDAQRGRGETA